MPLSRTLSNRKRGNVLSRAKGAQPGNKNALRHGYYSRHFEILEDADLDLFLITDLDNEIHMLRVAMRRLFAGTQTPEGVDLPMTAGNLTALGNTAANLAHLIREKVLLEGAQDKKVSDATAAALADITENLRKYRP